jgi:hypothetical protein
MWRLYLWGGLIAAAAVAFWFWLERHDEQVRAGVIAGINQATKELADEAVKARAPSLQPGAALRLRTYYCRDCETDVSGR